MLHEAHPKGRLILKFNHLTDPELIGPWSTPPPGAPGWTFWCGAPSPGSTPPSGRKASWAASWSTPGPPPSGPGEWRVYLTSADAMPRNFQNRFELLFPVLDKEAKKKVLKVLKRQVRDDRNSFLLTPEGEKRLWGGRHDAQRLEL